jgi:hypothetical protein
LILDVLLGVKQNKALHNALVNSHVVPLALAFGDELLDLVELIDVPQRVDVEQVLVNAVPGQ